MNQRYSFFTFFLLLLFAYDPLNGLIGNLAGALRRVAIKSVQQEYTDGSIINLKGNVHILIDDRLHIIADQVVINKQNNTLHATSDQDSLVKIEDEQFLMLATSFFLDYKARIGKAESVKIHLDEGFISAQSIEKINAYDWAAHDMIYTACDKNKSDWHIHAERAVIHGSYFVKMKGLTFNIKQTPVFGLPRFILPIQGHSKSGFLVPRFAVDYDYGFGVRQEYYKHISKHADTLFGIDWRLKKGLILYNQTRWARALESYTLSNINYSIIRDRFILRDNKIEKGTSRGYWIQAKDYSHYTKFFDGYDVSSIIAVDFGTNKLNGYHFFSSTEDVDDTFFNGFIARSYSPHTLISLWVDHNHTVRRQFKIAQKDEHDRFFSGLRFGSIQDHALIKQYEERFIMARMPHLEAVTSYKELLPGINLSHYVFWDHALFEREQQDRWFVDAALFSQNKARSLEKRHAIRFSYMPTLSLAKNITGFTLSGSFSPTLQSTSTLVGERPSMHHGALEKPLFSRGSWRIFSQTKATLAAPEFILDTTKVGSYSFQPSFEWAYLPFFKQEHWGYFDRYDRAYATHQLALRTDIRIDSSDIFFQAYARQAYDFYDKEKLFYLRRPLKQQHILPLEIVCDLNAHNFYSCGGSIEYDWRHDNLLQSRLWTTLNVKNIVFGVSYLFQKPFMQQVRGLLSDIPHFLLFSASIPLSDKAQIVYDGQFFAPNRQSMFILNRIVPLIHKIRFDYQGHCWGCSIGFEEKRYKECSIGRNERAIVFCLKLDSLGSFANKIKGSRYSDRMSDAADVER